MTLNQELTKEYEIVNRNNSNSAQGEEVYISYPSSTFPNGINLPNKQISNKTSDVTQSREYISSITQKAREFLNKYQNKDQTKQGNKLLEEIDNLLMGYDDLGLPKIGVSLADDGSIALNWRIGSAFFGAAIRPNTTESSWFLIQGDVEKGYKADGYLDDLDYETQLPSLFGLLIKTQIKQRESN